MIGTHRGTTRMSYKAQQFGEKAHAFILQPPDDDRKYTLLVGSVRSAKTWAVTAKMIVHLCKYQVTGRRLIVGRTKLTVHKNILIDLFEFVGRENYKYNQATGELWVLGCQWFILGAHDETSFANILGLTVGMCLGDEVIEWPRSFFMQLLLRMSPDGARFYGTTNPGNPNHYLKTEFIDNPKIQPDLNYLTFNLDDNPNLSDESKRTIIASQSGIFFLRYILGRWVSAEGAIYRDAWADDLLYTPDAIGPSLYGFGGWVDHAIFVDYGTVNPCCFIEAVDDGRVVHLDREYWWDSNKEMRQKTDAQYADDMLQWLSPSGYRDSEGRLSVSRVNRRGQPRIVLDPSAASFRAELQGRGLWVVDANNEVTDGIRKTANALTRKLIRVNRECANGIREIPAYMWDEDAAAKGEEKPVKQNDHWCDACRYGVEEMFSEYRLMAA